MTAAAAAFSSHSISTSTSSADLKSAALVRRQTTDRPLSAFASPSAMSDDDIAHLVIRVAAIKAVCAASSDTVFRSLLVDAAAGDSPSSSSTSSKGGPPTPSFVSSAPSPTSRSARLRSLTQMHGPPARPPSPGFAQVSHRSVALLSTGLGLPASATERLPTVRVQVNRPDKNADAGTDAGTSAFGGAIKTAARTEEYIVDVDLDGLLLLSRQVTSRHRPLHVYLVSAL